MPRELKPLMVMGTSSGAGKTFFVTAILSILRDMGVDAVPFKAQNISLNSAVAEGGEIAYAQAMQARAAGAEPSVLMNPVLIKPEKGSSHIVVMGKHYMTLNPRDYYREDVHDSLFRIAIEAFNELQKKHELVVIEGAGSPAEVNLKDIANVEFSKAVGAKNILISDIDRGGAFASILGTVNIMGRRGLIGAVLNKFRGDEGMLRPAYRIMSERYNIRILGAVPYLPLMLPWEDSADNLPSRGGKVRVGIVKLPHISNFTDFYPLYKIRELGISFEELPDPQGYDLTIIPGSKVTVHDLIQLKVSGFDEMLKNAVLDGRWIMGICGGLQMMGKRVIDRVESGIGEIDGLNVLEAETVMEPVKKVRNVEGTIIAKGMEGIPISGYEIHYGETVSPSPFAVIRKENGMHVSRPDGSQNAKVFGTYLHGIFENEDFTLSLVNTLRNENGLDALRGPIYLGHDKEIHDASEAIRNGVNLAFIFEAIGLKP
ncbi:MAG: cobyric acid synthase [Conexivisphaerales archaeon]